MRMRTELSGQVQATDHACAARFAGGIAPGARVYGTAERKVTIVDRQALVKGHARCG